MAVILKPQKGPQERFLSTPADIAIYGGAAGGGKAQPKDEPVLTPKGFVKMGKLKVGDEVIAPDGKAVTIIQIHEQGVVPVYSVKLFGGRETRCTDNHLWQCTIKGQRAVRETRELRSRIREGIMIPVCQSPGSAIVEYRVLAIEPCGTKRCRCITLASADGLYITKDYIVTHNSYGLLLTPLRYIRTQGFGATIFRKNYNQIFAQGGLWDESVGMYSAIPNTYSSQSRGVWIFNDKNGAPVSKINFAHIERFEDTKNWQGSQLCALCCEENTPVRMSDGTEKPIKDIRAGDFVDTLNGAAKVTAIGEPREADCVVIELPNGEKQIQSADHKVLTLNGWVSYDDAIAQLDKSEHNPISIQCRSAQQSGEHSSLTFAEDRRLSDKCSSHLPHTPEHAEQALDRQHSPGPCEHTLCGVHQPLTCGPILCCCESKCDRCFRQRCQEFLQPHDSQHSDRQQVCEADQPISDHQEWPGTCACTGQQDRGNCSESSFDRSQAHEQPLSDRHSQAHAEQSHESSAGIFSDGELPDEQPYARNGSERQDFRDRCSSCFRPCDAHARLTSRSDEDGALLLDGVVVRSPSGLISDAQGSIPTNIHQTLLYEHPHKRETVLTSEAGDYDVVSVKITPIGKKVVVPITVDFYNHYITKSGLVNRNCFDELTHFDRQTFFYMLSRNRSTCGVKPFIRATCNPDATSWVADFISWWIDQDTGYPIPERSGKLRWFIRDNDVIYWADTKEELWKQFELITEEERAEPKSVTFIASSIYDNKELLRVNPQYLANLKALPTIEREQLLKGNWKIKPAAGLYFKASQVGDFLTVIPNDVVQWVRCWDLAATENDGKGEPAYTAGVLMGKRKNGRYIVADVINKQMSAADVRNTIRLTAQRDREKYKRVRIRIPQDPGQAGKDQAQSYVRLLSGFDIVTVPETGSKESRAEPLAAQWQGGNVDILQADWTDDYLQQMENFPEWKFKDMVDASANGFTELEHKTQFNLSSLV